MIKRWSKPPQQEVTKPMGFDDFDLRLGDVMRGERATMAKSLLDVQRELKIKATYIAAIENADPTAFETQGFIAGYVRSYSRYLNLDPEWAFERFCQESNFETAHGMSAEASSARSVNVDAANVKAQRDPFAADAIFVPQSEAFLSKIEPGAIGSSLVLLALIGVIGFGGWSVLKEIQKVQFAPVAQAPGVTSTLDDLGTAGAVTAALEENTGFDAPNADALDRLYRPAALDVPVLVARDGPISTLDPSTIGNLATHETESRIARASGFDTLSGHPLESAVQVVSGDVPEVRLFAVRPSWVRVSAADGTVLFEKILDAGESYVLTKTQEAPVLRAGNAGSVYFAVNGENYGPAGNGPSVVKGVQLSAEALRETFAMADLAKDNDLANMVAVAQADTSE